LAIFYDIHNLPDFKNAVLTVGFFDGVHKGHKAILNEVVTHALTAEGESVLLTFEPHPRKLLYPEQNLGIITPLQQKLQLITDAGIQHIVVVPFTKEFANLSATQYIEDFLVGLFRPHSIVLGYDHRFGHDRKGDIGLLKEYGPKYNYAVIEISEQLINEAAVSSTKIRNAISEGKVADAATMLERPYSLEGTVIHGKRLGRTIGYPTANIHPLDKDQLIPAIGIYAVLVNHAGTTYKGMLSIGHNPTVTDTKDIKIEVNIFDFDKDIYEQQIELLFIAHIRDEEKFDSLDALKEQIRRDEVMARKLLG